MSWNIAPECVSTVVLSIIWIYSRKGNPIPSLTNKLFQACFFATFCAMTSNILSTYMLSYLSPSLYFPAWIVTTFYFITTPLMGLVYGFYVVSNIYEESRRTKGLYLLLAVPGILYLAAVLTNPFTKCIFSISLEEGYTQEKYLMVTYLVFYFYCIFCVVLVLLRWRSVPPYIRIVLFTFPIIAAAVIVVQLLFPDIILSGTAATSALLVIYLYLQNKQISIDYLTKVPNRQEFLKMLELKTKNPANSSFSIIVLSLKEFKTINDTFGQHNGDAVLVAFSDYLKTLAPVRGESLYRYSGDEFALLAEESEQEKTGQILGRILERMKQPWKTEQCTCMLSAGIGIITYPECANDSETLINAIEYSVSIAKGIPGKSNVCYCDQELMGKARRRQQIIGILKDYLEQDRFEMYYQPILDTKSQRFVLAEALMRIHDSPLGSISPGEFIPIAEESGLIIDITYQIFDKVCRCIRRVLDAGIELDGINVNFSALQFTQKDLIPRLVSIMEKREIPFSKIKIEITESTLAENSEVVTAFANRMHEIGVGVSLDDFGTGYSNLTSVISLPIDTVKLDRGLIWTAMDHDRTRIVVKNLSHAFCELGMTVLAEGIESEDQSRFVTECGCSLIQGFLYAKPLPEEAFLDAMKNR